MKKVTAVATTGNQPDRQGAATHDNDFDSHINDNDMAQAANNINPDNNNTITSSQTDLYSVLGPDRVDMFYDDGVIFGYDPKYLGNLSSENAREQGERHKVVVVMDEEEEEEQEEPLLEEERLQAEGADEEEEVYHDGPKPFDETNYPLHFFYERYFTQFPGDNTLQDTDSDYSASSADEEVSDNDGDKPAGAAHTHTPTVTGRRKAQGWVRPSAKKSRLDQRTRVRPGRLENFETVDDVESAEGGEGLQQPQDQDQSTAATASIQRSGETFEKYQQRMRWDRELEAMKASFLRKAQESNPNKVKLSKKELDAVHLRHREKLALYESSDLRVQQHARDLFN
ncbi:hypothetical protein BGZ90_004891 [Linnemannia elongata]|nr:hypothetical protein BGZ90_004891 [Linnemannia elongata]